MIYGCYYPFYPMCAKAQCLQKMLIA